MRERESRFRGKPHFSRLYPRQGKRKKFRRGDRLLVLPKVLTYYITWLDSLTMTQAVNTRTVYLRRTFHFRAFLWPEVESHLNNWLSNSLLTTVYSFSSRKLMLESILRINICYIRYIVQIISQRGIFDNILSEDNILD